jgi:ankyrin repeat protein
MDERLKAAVETGDETALEQLIREEPGVLDGHDGELSPVMLAAYHGRPTLGSMMLAVRGPAGLFEAAALGLDDRVKELVGWDPRAVVARSPDGFTALHLAAYFGHANVVRRLLEEGVDPEPVADNPTEVRPLHSAVAGGSVEVVELLLEAGADVEVRQQGGFTPLMGAAAAGSEALVRRLLEAGADAAACADDGKTVLDLASEAGHEHLWELLGS